MIFNCLNCCKAISSLHKCCPYCMVEVHEAVEKVGIEVKPMTIQMTKAISPEGTIRARLTGAITKLTSITQILHQRRGSVKL
ncbi:MAG: hypothetical protein UT36_C0002G0045 [Candidatus Peregrinibacteria bacterium GW2011_GWF2_39_17]|nr:MAG: hypothetical protein UT36_C0002G0045 [Candidatus Peregrinibacteria bacterium GW2011_GWF2_39_17]